MPHIFGWCFLCQPSAFVAESVMFYRLPAAIDRSDIVTTIAHKRLEQF